MEPLPEHIKKQVLEDELEKLVIEQYISNEMYHQIIERHDQYYEDYYEELKGLLSDELIKTEPTLALDKQTEEIAHQTKSYEGVSTESIDEQKQVEPSFSTEQQAVEKDAAHVSMEQKEQSRLEDTMMATDSQLTKSAKTKEASRRKVRERNIVWTLSIGVAFLLIAGTFLATSTWYMLPDIVKTFIIALVAGLFFGMALLTDRVLHIAKTALAFYVLGALFLPIIIISIGFYGHLGMYLSFEGDGKYLLGALGGLVLFPIYLHMARKRQARLFIWFSYISLTFIAGFLIGWLNLSIDGFYLGMILFNTGLIIAYRFAKKKGIWAFFIRDFALYLQANLILTSALMIFFFDNAAFNGFNLIITAALYLTMITVTNYRSYHYVFTLFLVYGAYQVIEHSFLYELDAILYALLGFVFILLPNVTKDRHHLSKVFHYTSALISGAAFLFISYQALTLTMDQSSVVLFIAYVLIAGNFLYLANIFGQQGIFFGYISATFMMVSLYELVLIGRDVLGYTSIHVPLFMMAFLFYVLCGCFMRHSFFTKLTYSARDVSSFLMLLLILTVGSIISSWEAGVMFLLLSVTALFTARFETRWEQHAITVGSWVHPISLGLATIAFYTDSFDMIAADLTYAPTNSIVAGIVVLLLSVVWRQMNKPTFYNISFYMAQIFYLIGMLQTFNFLELNMEPITRVIILFGGVLMAYVLHRKTKWLFTPFYMSGITFAFYLVSLYALHQQIHITSPLFFALQFIGASIFLFGVGYILQHQDIKLRTAYYWVAHSFLPIGLWMGLLSTDESGFWAVLLTGIIYGISLRMTKIVPVLYFFLYGALSMIALGVAYIMMLLDLDAYLEYSFIATVAIFIALWFGLSKTWQYRMNFYMMPFMILSLMVYIIPPIEWPMMIINCVLTIITVWFLFKLEWKFFALMPLLILYVGFLSYGMPDESLVYGLLLAYAILLFAAGMVLHKKAFIKQKNLLPVIDWFSFIGYLSLLTLHTVAGEYIVDKILPDILIVIALWIQRHRFPQQATKWIVFFAGVYLLKPYYTVLDYVHIPELIETELYVLPWIAVVVLLKKIVSPQMKTAMHYIEWAVLGIVAIVLMSDALHNGTIYDAVILGTLALVSLLVGMNLYVKSYFFIGLFVLILNFLLQTKPFWANMPWWVYLLVAGTLLIGVASYNEWSKQKRAEGEVSKLRKWLINMMKQLKEWD